MVVVHDYGDTDVDIAADVDAEDDAVLVIVIGSDLQSECGSN